MKKILIALIMLLSHKTDAQITYEQSYPGPNSSAFARLVIINLGNNDYKYFYFDYNLNQLKLFNMDHSPYTTVNAPFPLIDESKYTVGYITKSLFDCDTTMFEYAIMPGDGTKNFYVYRQDGTQLFERDSTIAPWCFGCFNASYDFRAITNTPTGAKLFLLKADSTGALLVFDVYSLCGTLPEDGIKVEAASTSYVKVCPNPALGTTDFQFDLPNNIKNYELDIFNSVAEIIKRIRIQNPTERFHLDGIDLSSGQYYYTVTTENKVLQNGKFILNK
jgi:hypothetical protein